MGIFRVLRMTRCGSFYPKKQELKAAAMRHRDGLAVQSARQNKFAKAQARLQALVTLNLAATG